MIQTDASGVAIAGVLLQDDGNGLLRPIAFCSRKLSETEQKYSASERELLAIVYAYEQFLSHVYGREIIIHTDHKPLVSMAKLKKPMGRLGRLFFRLVDVDYKLVHVSGIDNHLPDFLSRANTIETNECQVSLAVLSQKIDWKLEQSKDEEIK